MHIRWRGMRTAGRAPPSRQAGQVAQHRFHCRLQSRRLDTSALKTPRSGCHSHDIDGVKAVQVGATGLVPADDAGLDQLLPHHTHIAGGDGRRHLLLTRILPPRGARQLSLGISAEDTGMAATGRQPAANSRPAVKGMRNGRRQLTDSGGGRGVSF